MHKTVLAQFFKQISRSVPSSVSYSSSQIAKRLERARELFVRYDFVPFVAGGALFAAYIGLVERFLPKAVEAAKMLGVELSPDDPWSFKAVTLASYLNAAALGVIEYAISQEVRNIRIALLPRAEAEKIHPDFTGEVSLRELPALALCTEHVLAHEYVDCVVRMTVHLSEPRRAEEIGNQLRRVSKGTEVQSTKPLLLAALAGLAVVIDVAELDKSVACVVESQKRRLYMVYSCYAELLQYLVWFTTGSLKTLCDPRKALEYAMFLVEVMRRFIAKTRETIRRDVPTSPLSRLYEAVREVTTTSYELASVATQVAQIRLGEVEKFYTVLMSRLAAGLTLAVAALGLEPELEPTALPLLASPRASINSFYAWIR